MSFFDDASLAFLPSGAAGKDGKAYSIKPVPVFGSELVTNGDFATDTDWSKGGGTTISGGKANFSNASSVSLYQNIGTPGSVRATFSVTDYTSGSLKIYAGGYPIGTSLIEATAVGDYSVEINTAGGNGNIIFGSSDNFTGSIDNVSIKEIISGDFTFSRGSNLAATRVGADGLIEKGRENLLLQSNSFLTTWTQVSISPPTSGQAGYDGSTDAWYFEKTGAFGRLQQSISTSGVQTLSVYLKAKDSSWVNIEAGGNNTSRQYFDLNAPIETAKGSSSNIISSSIEDAGDGWRKCSITYEGTKTFVFIFIAEGNGQINGTSGSLYIQDAQLEIGLAATDYIETGASTGKAGLLEDEPRFDYSGGATCPSLLLEPSRTNLEKLSEYIGGWSLNSNITRTSNYTISPEGTQNATRLQFTANGFAGNNTQASSTQYTLSCYAKRNDSGTQSVGFFVNGSGSVDSAWSLTSDWQRFTYTYTSSNTSYAGIAGISGADVSVYGFQVEQASYPTSYIPNHSGGSVTRGADDSVATGLGSISGQSEGTLFAYFKTIGDSGTPYISLNQNNGVSNRVLIYNNSGIGVEVRVGGSVQASITSSTQGLIKAAISYKANDFAFYINGSQIGTDSSGSTFGAGVLNQLNLGFGAQDGAEINQVLLFDTRLSNADLATLTTI